ncbi:N-acyl homoserine lactonase family protein [Streptomyces sp. LP05-1]|uniref:N-acyl homoserine lactonase family protein n=1 Tax=Streptomyces pyxinae TaxID=2970734 RepID=A0ABT2CFQ8_9ACTN|nr:N-acyl homoserine lactonase family protein [Streptomyces sp. LP05-1]MCS0636249.1 N-acyl homoserine lactonase family protein [Streptomyces sp. LP05-1]
MRRMTATVHRLDLGYFLRPADEAEEDHPRAEPVLAYLVRHRAGTLLFDTGVGGGDPAAEAHYRPRRHDLADRLAAAGTSLGSVDLVVNCHLHFDHCGGNPLLAGRPVLVQRTELAAARADGYTIDALVDFPGARYEELDGPAEIWPGVHVVPTPGHTEGHQSLVVAGPDGATVLAGQAHDFASHFASAEMARRAALDPGRPGTGGPRPGPYPGWLDTLAGFRPRRVLFAHDRSVWEGTLPAPR